MASERPAAARRGAGHEHRRRPRPPEHGQRHRPGHPAAVGALGRVGHRGTRRRRRWPPGPATPSGQATAGVRRHQEREEHVGRRDGFDQDEPARAMADAWHGAEVGQAEPDDQVRRRSSRISRRGSITACSSCSGPPRSAAGPRPMSAAIPRSTARSRAMIASRTRPGGPTGSAGAVADRRPEPRRADRLVGDQRAQHRGDDAEAHHARRARRATGNSASSSDREGQAPLVDACARCGAGTATWASR